jgi:hypothetical protein
MDVHAALEADCDADTLFAFVDDLDRYPAWKDLVHRVEPLAGDGTPAWQVELRARVGPLARSKRLRMQRTVHDTAARRVVFERAEADGKRHAVGAERRGGRRDGRHLDMHLHYGGALWSGGVLERVLADQIRNGRDRLAALVSAEATGPSGSAG